MVDLKLYDDVSPVFDEDEFDMEYDFGTSVPDSPAVYRLPSSIQSTPMTPSMRCMFIVPISILFDPQTSCTSVKLTVF